MSVEVKICGLSSLETLDAALDAGADHVGFVFYEKSPRNVSLQQGAELVRHARGRAKTVALVVEPSTSLLDDIMVDVQPDVVQFHGAEGRALINAFHSRYFDAVIWKALPVASRDDLAAVETYETTAHRILFDARPPQGADRPGGHGHTFDWSLLREVDPGLGYFLSGGLTPDNVVEALRNTQASGVDVSSGVESAPGIKDAGKIRAFIQAAREARAKVSS